MKRRDAIAREIGALTPALARTFTHRDEVCVPGVIIRAISDAWTALDDGEHIRAETLVRVIKFLIQREGVKFRANPAGWMAHQRALMELAA
jgi:hypothetical protein